MGKHSELKGSEGIVVATGRTGGGDDTTGGPQAISLRSKQAI
jgi:hypothetical protein